MPLYLVKFLMLMKLQVVVIQISVIERLVEFLVRNLLWSWLQTIELTLQSFNVLNSTIYMHYLAENTQFK